MSGADVPVLNSAVNWHRASLAEWRALEGSPQSRAKIAFLIAVTVLAYHYSLISLLQTIGDDTPLAYLGLVPLIACGLAWINRVPRTSEPPIHDRQLDYSIGLPLVAGVLLAALMLPGRLGAMYWVNRLDLLFLPLFVAGTTILLFGVRVAWRQKVALAYLFLAWPWLYTSVLLGKFGGFTSLTLSGINAALHVVHVASPVGGAANQGLFQVVHQGTAYPVSLVTACSGIDGMVGFFLIGIALTTMVSGSLARKALWLVSGVVLFWIANLVRLLFIFWVGTVGGEHLAFDVLHPIAGLVMFCLGLGLMSLMLRPFGLRFIGSDRLATPHPTATNAAPRIFFAAAMLLVAALVLSVSNTQLRAFDPVAGAAGEPKLGSFLAEPANPAGWAASFQTEYTINKPLFGQDSRWFRYLYSPTSPALSPLHSTLPVTADVIDASSLGGFDAYGVAACYSFHGYNLRDVETVDLGEGISGQALSYAGGTSHQDWSIVYWVWPVKTASGTRYERVILYLQNTSSATVSVSAGTPGIGALEVGLQGADRLQHRLIANRAFLVEFARQIISGQIHQKDTGVLINAVQAPGTPSVKWAAQAGGGVHLVTTVSSSPSVVRTHDFFWITYFAKHPRSASAAGQR